MKPDVIQFRPGGCWLLPPLDTEAGAPAPVDAPEGLKLRGGEPFQAELTLFDTWDWSLWHSGLVLLSDGTQLQLHRASSHGAKNGTRRQKKKTRAPGAEQPLAIIPLAEPPPFAHEQPAGPLSDIVAPRLGLRAACSVGTVEVEQRIWDVCNGDEKVVVRVLEQVWSNRARTIMVVPLRGYDDEAKAMRRQLPPEGTTDLAPLTVALKAAGVEPRVWTNKPLFALADETRAYDAVVEMLESMLALARQTEAGIIEDIDTEFLHDYRVLVRKARSLLALSKGVFDADDTAALKHSFRALGQRTNQLRDLDVHIMEHDDQVARVPEPLRPGLEPLFRSLHLQRAKSHAELVAILKGAGYRRRVGSLEKAIRQAKPGPKAEQPIRKLANKRLSAQLSTVLLHGRAITPETPDEAVHALRIDCKKLRYLLEFFRALYPENEVTPTARSLKRLQDVLGTFNDLSVQQDALHTWLAETSSVRKPTAVSVGALLGALSAEQAEVRSHVEEAFAAFDEPSLRKRFRAGAVKRRRKDVA